jgi:hypothetical protein
MNISGIRTQAGFYDYNTIKNNELRGQQIREAKTLELSEPDIEAQAVAQTTERQETTVATAEVDNGATAFNQQYQPDATYELKGAESDIASLDIEKVVSDLKKDSVLMQYQVFISGSRLEEEDPAGRKSINFML